MDELFRDGAAGDYSRNQALPVASDTYLISDGFVGLYSAADDGTRRLLFVYKSGEIFPLAAGSSVFPERNYIYIALGRVKVRSLANTSFRQLISLPEHAQLVITQLQEMMLLQLERIDNMQKYQVGERLLERLVFFAKRHGVVKGDKVYLDLPMSHVDLATSIGTSRETVNRYMKQFEAQGILTVRKQRITVSSMDKLLKMQSGKDGSLRPGWLLPVVALSSLVIQGALVTIGS